MPKNESVTNRNALEQLYEIDIYAGGIGAVIWRNKGYQ